VGGKEDGGHERPELRVVADEQEEEEGAEQRGGGEGGKGQLDELVGEPVVARFACAPTNDLDDDGEDGNPEDERGEVQVELGDRPHGEARAEHGEVAVRGLADRLLRVRRRDSGESEDSDDGEETEHHRGGKSWPRRAYHSPCHHSAPDSNPATCPNR